MTPTKIVNRLVDFGPSVIGPHTKRPDHCVLATAVGVDVLQTFGIDARPLCVRISLVNKILLDYVAVHGRIGDADVPVLLANGGHMLDTGGPEDAHTGTVNDRGWFGHLIVWVPHVNGGGVVDLSLGAFNRPAKDIIVPPSGSFQFRPPGCSYTLPCGAELRYEMRPDDVSWMTAKDWAHPSRREPIVRELVAVIRRGRL